MTSKVRRLEAFTWLFMVAQNEILCNAKSAYHNPTSFAASQATSWRGWAAMRRSMPSGNFARVSAESTAFPCLENPEGAHAPPRLAKVPLRPARLCAKAS